MGIDKIKAAAALYQGALAKVKDNRRIWQEVTEKLILSVLNEVAGQVPLNWAVHQTEELENLEGVALVFLPEVSGISHSYRQFLKQGGQLVFTQTYNGEVLVAVVFPMVEEVIAAAEPKILAKILPEDINEGFVLEQVEKFLLELANWEITMRHSIGFKK